MATRPNLTFTGVSFAYEFGSQVIFDNISLQFTTGWTGITGPNGSGKTTLLRLACGLLSPNRGFVSKAPLARYCEQRTDEPPVEAGSMMASTDREALLIRARLGLIPEDLARWPTLSHGERKRFQIGEALFSRPTILALDEPTNHLDSEAQDLLFQALREYSGIGLLVSHDRELLDRLCDRCVFIRPPDVTMRTGNYSEGKEQERIEDAGEKKRRDNASAKLGKLQREHSKRKGLAARSVRRNPKRGLSRKDSDSREKADRARVTGQDAARGSILNQMKGRLEKAKQELDETTFQKEHPTGIVVLGSICKRNSLFNLPAGSVPLGDNGVLHHPDLSILPGDRIALVGPNGSGKSTLMEHIRSILPVPDDMVTYVPQEISADGASELLRELRRAAGDQLGWLMNIISRLGSRPERLLMGDRPSPGETRKIQLALGLLHEPWLLMMDEPTNHLDLFSIECLESGLMGFQGSMLLVSHDRQFLEKTTTIRWEISPLPGEGGQYRLTK